MGAQALDQHTYLPQAAGVGLAEVVGFLDAHERRRGDRVEPRYLLVGAGEHDQVELPAEVHAALKQVVAALQAGRAVTVAPQATMLTTQQAADLLGVSRPTVRRWIDVGSCRRRRSALDIGCCCAMYSSTSSSVVPANTRHSRRPLSRSTTRTIQRRSRSS